MSDSLHTPSRRLLVVEPCAECLRLLPTLREAGWTITTCSIDQSCGQSAEVALLRLRRANLKQLQTIRHMIAESNAAWIAVIDVDPKPLSAMGDFIGEWLFDFHTLPFDVLRLMVTIGRAYGMSRLRNHHLYTREGEPHELVGVSLEICKLRKLLTKLAPSNTPVLIRGESGTGKELVARTLHRQSERADKPSVAINCGAIPQHLIQSELFGHEKGAFTGAHQRKIGLIETADGGTLFLDEIGDLPLDLQANLLRFLQEMTIERVGGRKSIKVDVRVIAATHVDLEKAIAQGRFRADLYYRLNVLQVRIPALRDRPQDVPHLAHHFSNLYSVESGRRARRFSEAALLAMGAYHWPGNVRELANRIRRALLLSEGLRIEPGDLGLTSPVAKAKGIAPLEDYKLQAERQALNDALLRHSENLSQGARVLGISRPTFYRLLHKHHLIHTDND